MSRLLRANFARLWKNKVFLGCLIFMFADAASTVISCYKQMTEIGGEYALSFLEPFGQTVSVAVVSAIFIGLFIGTEHSCGTLRNKLIIGAKRSSVYLANLAVCAAATVMIHIAYFAVILICGAAFLGGFGGQGGKIAWLFAISIIVVTAFAAMFLPVSMLIASKSSGSSAVIVGAFVLVIAALVINSALSEPEVFEAYTLTDSYGNVISEPEMKNPYYVSGVKRKICEVLYDVLPTSHAARIQIGDMPENPAVVPLWSSAVIIATTVGGALAFSGKDLK